MQFQHSGDIWRDFPALVPGILYAEGITTDVPIGSRADGYACRSGSNADAVQPAAADWSGRHSASNHAACNYSAGTAAASTAVVEPNYFGRTGAYRASERRAADGSARKQFTNPVSERTGIAWTVADDRALAAGANPFALGSLFGFERRDEATRFRRQRESVLRTRRHRCRARAL